MRTGKDSDSIDNRRWTYCCRARHQDLLRHRSRPGREDRQDNWFFEIGKLKITLYSSYKLWQSFMTTPPKYASKPLDRLAADYEGFRPEYRLASAESLMVRLAQRNQVYRNKTLPQMHVMFKATLKRLKLTTGLKLYESDMIQRAEAERQRKEESKTARRNERSSRQETLDVVTERESADPDAAVDYVGLPGRFNED